MRMLFALILSFAMYALSGENQEIRTLIESRFPTNDQIEALKAELKHVKSEGPKREIETQLFGISPCKNCQSKEVAAEDPRILVFISFSIPDTILISLSKELEKAGGVFVIRGLPGNSFSNLSKKLIDLTNRGMRTPVWLDPIKFKTFNIETVPSFVVIDGEEHHKIAGCVSIEYALKKINRGD